jgi:hypothetical protein
MVTGRASLLMALPLLATAGPAYAYVDPNVGGQLWQAIYPVVAVALGALAFARQWLAHLARRVSGALRGLFARTDG